MQMIEFSGGGGSLSFFVTSASHLGSVGGVEGGALKECEANKPVRSMQVSVAAEEEEGRFMAVVFMGGVCELT